MTPELLLSIGPSVVAIAVAVIGAVTQSRSRIADDARFAAQREADDRRWMMQREADESRMKLQINAEADALAAAHVRAVDLRGHEERATLNRERAERLRQEAGAFVTVLGVSQSVASSISAAIQQAAEVDDWDHHDQYFKTWTSDLRARLTAATAVLRIIGGDDVSRLAQQAHQSVKDEVEALSEDYRKRDSAGIAMTRRLLWTIERDIENFAAAVSAELAQIEG